MERKSLGMGYQLQEDSVTEISMIRWCTYCQGQITNPRRLRRASPYCSDECKRAAHNEMRREVAKKECRLCGRRLRRLTNK
jgi:endogenous inhibitor of DNA gyrase (YacG/DUF329 family)